ncbi:GNAT family N-acetyltransferase [Aeromicrobium sp. 636]|uniref:GNAT family N-acetyltransferase n=1 Tax=Aeromicrobium senzhongii TaxID=2663859 RepID=A0A8I0JZG1_9ACTN|nr:GNAT family N-acetyltransferase [Aeromicrobium sp. 636]MBC9225261.1 GNAT family N-acetyltransferase [Aeromicrobium senzhongii]MCQ3997371.1 GNAT family N-acetyltransferase [Aeromicrobium sp. 636]
MTDDVSALTVRPARHDDQPTLEAWSSREPVEWVDRARLSAELGTRNYRYEWSWIAERGDRPVGRALWWGSENAERPVTLDCLLVAESEPHPDRVGAALIRAGIADFGAGPELEFNVDVDVWWTQNPAAVEAVEWRSRAAHAGGFTRSTERLSFARTDSTPRPPRPRRLGFRPGTDDEFRTLFAAVAPGSLDAHTLAMVAEQGVDALADDDLQFYLSLPGSRDAWRIATLADGTTVGFTIATRTAYDASISYLGVLPEHRGRGFVDELLAQMVHLHHDDGEQRIVGTTDAANAPMAAAFGRAGFETTRVRIVHAR